jgi:hypothetical protein
MTPIDLITLALKQAGVVGVGQTPLSEDANDAFSHLNMMLAQWNRRRWLVYHLVDVACLATGSASYRIGAGEALDTRGRVTGIESAYWRMNGRPGPNSGNSDFSSDFGSDFAIPGTALHNVVQSDGIDIPLRVIPSREDYSRLAYKGFTGFPSSVWLDADYPVGNLYVWPAPTQGEIHVIVQEQLSAFPDLTTPIALPDEYQDALFHNLVVRLRSAYGRPADPVVIQLAKVALNTIRGANAQIGTLQMPSFLPVRGGSYGGGGDFAFAVATAPTETLLPPITTPPITDPGPVVVIVDGGREG